MKVARVIALALLVPAPGLVGAEAAPRSPTEKPKAVAPALDFTVKDIDGKDVHLGTYQGKVLLVVNVASQCGLTDRQYVRLELLYEKYRK
ncbi:MAG: glutathione peroxidase, partial [Planctomycetota bacterium]